MSCNTPLKLSKHNQTTESLSFRRTFNAKFAHQDYSNFLSFFLSHPAFGNVTNSEGSASRYFPSFLWVLCSDFYELDSYQELLSRTVEECGKSCIVYYRCSQWENTFYSIYIRWCKTRFVLLGGKRYNTQNEVKHALYVVICASSISVFKKTIANPFFFLEREKSRASCVLQEAAMSKALSAWIYHYYFFFLVTDCKHWFSFY